MIHKGTTLTTSIRSVSSLFNKDTKLVVFLERNKEGAHGAPRLQSLSISPRKHCEFHHDESRRNASDVVIIKAELLKDEGEVGDHDIQSQKWIYYAWEDAKNTHAERYPHHCNKFNITMTYSKHSDIYFPYGECIKAGDIMKHIVDRTIVDALKSKDRLVAWMVSDCRTAGRRENYVRQLLRSIPVDIYGECGDQMCDKGAACDKYVSRYKFYLAFENSLCGEYITEKLWGSFAKQLVPIVYGGLEAYKSVLPPHSYIDVEDFSSPEKLANYLIILNKNETLYRQYFAWRYTHRCDRVNKNGKSLRVCEYLHDHINERQDKLSLMNVWISHSNRCEDAEKYLTRLGVQDTRRRAFTPEDAKIKHNNTLH